MPYHELRRENPWLLVLATTMLVSDLLYYAFRLVQGGPDNIAHAVVSTFCAPSIIAALLVAAALLVLPNVWCAIRQDETCAQTASKAAVIGCTSAAAVWLVIAWLSSRHGSYWLVYFFGTRAVGCMCLAAILGSMLNEARRRELKGDSSYAAHHAAF